MTDKAKRLVWIIDIDDKRVKGEVHAINRFTKEFIELRHTEWFDMDDLIPMTLDCSTYQVKRESQQWWCDNVIGMDINGKLVKLEEIKVKHLKAVLENPCQRVTPIQEQWQATFGPQWCWKHIWNQWNNLQVRKKVLELYWKVFQNALEVNGNQHQENVTQLCPWCNLKETVLHHIWECPTTQLLIESGINWWASHNNAQMQKPTITEWILQYSNTLPLDAQWIIRWCIWKHRNEKVHRQQVISNETFIGMMEYEWKRYLNAKH